MICPFGKGSSGIHKSEINFRKNVKNFLAWADAKLQFGNFRRTRSCAALRAADLDWIVGPEYSLGRKEEGVQGRKKQKRY